MLIETLRQDFGFAVRGLRRSLGFTTVAVITLALGIGANTAIFSVVNALLLRPLPFEDPDRLVLIWGDKQLEDWPELPLSLPNFTDVRDQSQSFESLAAWVSGTFNLSGGAEPEQVQYGIVTANLFSTLGVGPLLGRAFLPAEDQPGCAPVIVVSHSLWQRRFGADPDLVGKALTLDGQSYEVVGVMPSNFRFVSFPKETEIWVPFGLDPFKQRKYARGANALGAVGRLEPGATLAQAQAEVDTIAARLAQQHPSFNAGWGLRLVPLHEQVVKGLRVALQVLLAAVAFVLLIACANVANLLLTRGRAREREIAIRAALGASRGRLIQLLLIESLVLAVFGGALGLLVAFWGIDFLAFITAETRSLFIPFSVLPGDIRVDRLTLGFTLGLSLLTGVVFGLVPAFQSSRPDLNTSLKEGGVRLGGIRHNRARNLLVVSEVALCLTLMVGAGLMVKSFMRIQSVDPGFQPENVLAIDVDLPKSKYPENRQVAAFYEQLLEHIGVLPGVQAAGAVEFLPLSGVDSSTGLFIEGRPAPAPGEDVKAHFRSVSPDYFPAMGIAVLVGRKFTQHDGPDATRVAVVNETMARRFWPGEDPIGKHVALDLEAMKFFPDRAPELDVAAGMREIVGVVADVKHSNLTQEPVPEMYVPYLQRPERTMTLVLRTASDPLSLVGAVQSEVTALDKDQPISNVTTLSDLLSDSVAQPRFSVLLLAAFALLALLLSAVGIYGVTAYSVTQRTHEIGVRMALGAQPGDVLRLIVKEGAVLAAAGTLIGLVSALALNRFVASLLFGVSPRDPATFIAVASLLAVVTIAACYLPARRATKVDPMVALRHE
jgi:putative ABC transport system permease protein